jgi:hypothetical protein
MHTRSVVLLNAVRGACGQVPPNQRARVGVEHYLRVGRTATTDTHARLESRGMPMVVRHETGSLFVCRAQGNVTYGEVSTAIGELLENEELGTGSTLLLDNRGVTNTLEVGQIALAFNDFKKIFARGLMKLAILSDNDLVHGRSQMFAAFAYSIGTNSRCFRDESAARAWVSASP